MSSYACGSFGNISVGSEVVYVYGLNMEYDRCSFDCGTDEFDISDVEFSVGEDGEVYRSGRGVVGSIDGEIYYLVDGTEIDSDMYMVIEVGSGGKEFIDYVDSVMYPLNPLHRSMVGLRRFRQGLFSYVGVSDSGMGVKECAVFYGERVKCRLLSPDGCKWGESEMLVDANFLREMEKGSIKDVFLI